MATLLPYCLRLDCTVASTFPRLASGDVANTLPDGISTHMITHPCFVAQYVINYYCSFEPPPILEIGLRHLSHTTIRKLFYNILFATAYSILPSIARGLAFSFIMIQSLKCFSMSHIPYQSTHLQFLNNYANTFHSQKDFRFFAGS